MLAKYWRLRLRWSADQTLTYDNGARIAIRCSPWKQAAAPDYIAFGTTITEDLGFGAGETITNGSEVEGSVVDNTSNLYYGIKGYFEMIADASSTDGEAYLYLEESDDDTNWPSDQADFDIEEDLRLISILAFSTDAVDESRGTNFEF